MKVIFADKNKEIDELLASKVIISDNTASSLGLATGSTADTALATLQTNKLSTSGTANSATQLATARTIQTNLASTSAASFNGTANVTPGVTGILPIANGGTGNATGLAASATKLETAQKFRTNLSSASNASFDGTASCSPGVKGVLPVAYGGTGVTSLDDLKSALGVSGFDWGELSIGDSTWWANLKTWAASATADERALCIGKKKLVSLSTAVLGANFAAMICIGADQDGTGTLTFQTANLLPTPISFGSSAVWIGSTARTQCQNFYNYCSAKESIKVVSKGTCANINSGRNGAVTYNDETVFLLSEREMGLSSYSPISPSASSTTKAECTYGYNGGYPYYSNDTARVKHITDADGVVDDSTGYYWERSRSYNAAEYVCSISYSGAANDNIYSNDTGVYLAPAFVIG